MTNTTFSRTVRNALGLFEAFRRLGFEPDDLFALVHNKSHLAILARHADKEFVATAGPLTPQELHDFRDLWGSATTWWNQDAAEADREAAYQECPAAQDTVGFLAALANRGMLGRVPCA